ncbi:MAG: hypothetical protein ACLFQV_02560 [Vulcanimicrobiota bacterium]
MKKIMILGAGVFQIPAIKKARELGFETLVCSYYPDDPGMKMAHKAYNISTIDRKRFWNLQELKRLMA